MRKGKDYYNNIMQVHISYKVCLLAIAMVFGFWNLSHGQSREMNNKTNNMHSISLGVGVFPNINVEPGDLSIGSYIGSLSYMYWPDTRVNAELSFSLHDSDVSLGNTSSVISILGGANYYPRFLTLGSMIKPYFSGALGPYIRFVNAAGTSTTASRLGTRIGAGIDTNPISWLRIGLRGSYNFVFDHFEEEKTQKINLNNLQVSLEFGVIW